MRLDEDLALEAWRFASFARMGFDGTEIALLLAWDIDTHDAERLRIRDGQRTACTTEQALRILQPIDDYLVLRAPAPERRWSVKA